MEQYIPTKANELLKIKQNQIKMIEIRGYNINKNDETLLQYDPSRGEDTKSFFDHYDAISKASKISFLDALREIYSRVIDDKLEYIWIIYLKETKSDYIKLILGEIEEKNKSVDIQITNIIFITENSLSSQIIKKLSQFVGYTFTVFLYEELIVNISTHKWMPKYELLTPNEQKIFFQDNISVSPTNMPSFCVDDPMIKYIGGISGQVVRLIRKHHYSYTASKTSKTYKIISNTFIDNKKYPVYE